MKRQVMSIRYDSIIQATTVVIALSLGGVGTNALAVTPFYDGFETYTSGSVISQGGWIQASGSGSNELLTVETNPSVAVDGSKYLRIQDASSGVQLPARYGLGIAEAAGRITWYANQQTRDVSTGSDLAFTVYGNGSYDVLTRVYMRYNGLFGYVTNSSFVLSVPFNTNTWYKFQLDYNGSTKTFGLNVFQASNNSNVLSVADQHMISPVNITSINGFEFSSDSTGTGVWYVDAISLIPEPTTLSLLGCALGIAVAFRRSRRS